MGIQSIKKKSAMENIDEFSKHSAISLEYYCKLEIRGKTHQFNDYVCISTHGSDVRDSLYLFRT